MAGKLSPPFALSFNINFFTCRRLQRCNTLTYIIIKRGQYVRVIASGVKRSVAISSNSVRNTMPYLPI